MTNAEHRVNFISTEFRVWSNRCCMSYIFPEFLHDSNCMMIACYINFILSSKRAPQYVPFSWKAAKHQHTSGVPPSEADDPRFRPFALTKWVHRANSSYTEYEQNLPMYLRLTHDTSFHALSCSGQSLPALTSGVPPSGADDPRSRTFPPQNKKGNTEQRISQADGWSSLRKKCGLGVGNYYGRMPAMCVANRANI